jgi:hypothetical protein
LAVGATREHITIAASWAKVLDLETRIPGAVEQLARRKQANVWPGKACGDDRLN